MRTDAQCASAPRYTVSFENSGSWMRTDIMTVDRKSVKSIRYGLGSWFGAGPSRASQLYCASSKNESAFWETFAMIRFWVRLRVCWKEARESRWIVPPR